MQTIDLLLDDENEIVFKVTVEGTASAKTSCRLMMESGGFSYSFPGEMSVDGEVTISIPPLDKQLSEGTYKTDLEVLVDDRVFVPISINSTFTKSVKVVAEAVVKRQKPRVSASATVVSRTSGGEKKSLITRSSLKKLDEITNRDKKKKSIDDMSTSELKALLKGVLAKTRDQK